MIEPELSGLRSQNTGELSRENRGRIRSRQGGMGGTVPGEEQLALVCLGICWGHRVTMKVESHASIFSPHYKGQAVFEAGAREHAYVPDQKEHHLLSPPDYELFPLKPVERFLPCTSCRGPKSSSKLLCQVAHNCL